MFIVKFNKEEIYANDEVFTTEQKAKEYAIAKGKIYVGTNYENYIEDCKECECAEEIETFEEWLLSTTWFVEIKKI